MEWSRAVAGCSRFNKTYLTYKVMQIDDKTHMEPKIWCFPLTINVDLYLRQICHIVENVPIKLQNGPDHSLTSMTLIFPFSDF